MWRIGADIGGTFTDVVALSGDGRLERAKVLTTHGRYEAGVAAGIQRCLEPGQLSGVRRVVHGTTVATNAILEARHAPVGLITTAGFGDVLELRRSRRPTLYDLRWTPPAPLARREHRFEVSERIAADGTIVQALDPTALDACIETLRRDDVRAVAVCLINAHANPAHERLIVERLHQRLGNVKVTASSNIVPQIKEYERTSTTVVNAFLLPVVEDYLAKLELTLETLGVDAPLEIMQSDGTTARAAVTAERPFLIIESGPAAGAIAAARLAEELERPNAVAFDMGGTTTKATLIEGYRVGVTGEIEVGDSLTRGAGLIRGSGYAVLSPCLDLTEVGSGGGSIAWIDRGGALRVGPASSGSEPGPACYGLGGTEATVADAHVVLGYLNPVAIARGTRKIHKDLADAAIARLADRLGVSSLDAAYGVYSIANAQMRRAIRTVSVERGRDPRSFTLIAFGGAGGIHAAALAQELEMPEVIIPIAPGLFSGLGLLLSDIASSRTISWRERVTAETLPEIEKRVKQLTAEALLGLQPQDRASVEATIETTIGVRYVGQSSALQMSFDPAVSDHAEVRLADDFHAEHRRMFGQAAPGEPIETVSLRVRASLPAQRLRFADIHAASHSYDGDLTGELRDVFFGPGEGLRRTPVIDRSQLGDGAMAGPVVIEEGDGTVLVPPAFSVALHDSGSVILSVNKVAGESDGRSAVAGVR